MTNMSALGASFMQTGSIASCGGVPQCGGGGGGNEMLAKLLAEAMTNQDGSLKDGNKLGELLGKFMDENPDKYGSAGQYGNSWQDALTNGNNTVDRDALMQVLSDMIGAKSGGGFADELFTGGNAGRDLELFTPPGGQHAGGCDAHPATCGGDSGLSGVPNGQPGMGGSDVMGELMQFLSSLGGEALGGLLQKDGNGGSTFSSEEMEMLKEVALYMDQNPDVFGQPHDASGDVRSWVDELGEDNYLNAEETALFDQAIGNISTEMASFATAGNGSAATGSLFGGSFDMSDPADVSLNLGASTAAFNIMAQIYGQTA